MNHTYPATDPTRPEERAAEPATIRATKEEVSELARHGDPSQKAADQKATGEAARKAKHGVTWVRPSELMSHATARVAGRGIDFHAELTRRTRRAPVQAVAASHRAISEHARRLPPVTAFGRHGQSPTGATRSGIGLS